MDAQGNTWINEELEDRELFANLTLENRARAIEKYYPLVHHVYRSVFPSSCSDYVDLIAEGTLGLIEAVDGFDLEKGVKFKTYAFYKIKGKMLEFLRRQHNFLVRNQLLEHSALHQLIRRTNASPTASLDAIALVQFLLPLLTEAERRIIELIYLENMTQEEVAARLDCTPANVCIMRKRAIRRLSRLLASSSAGNEELAYQM